MLLQGLVPLLLQLRGSPRDGSLTMSVLELVVEVLCPPHRAPGAAGDAQGSAAATEGAQREAAVAALSDSGHMVALLEVLSEPDMWTRILAMQALAAMLRLAPDATNAALLQCSGGMVRVVELLDDPREEVRNEVLLLLAGLTRSNAEIRNVVAFEVGGIRLW
jgi:hypothetical protein